MISPSDPVTGVFAQCTQCGDQGFCTPSPLFVCPAQTTLELSDRNIFTNIIYISKYFWLHQAVNF